MARDLTSAAAAAVAADLVRPVIFYEGVYETGVLRLWSGVGTIEWNGQSWFGAGQMLGISPIEETSEIRAVGFSVALTADASAILSLNLGAARQGLPGSVWIGFFDENN